MSLDCDYYLILLTQADYPVKFADPFLVKHRWQTAASKALAQEEEIVPKMRKRDLDSAFNPFQGDQLVIITAKVMKILQKLILSIS